MNIDVAIAIVATSLLLTGCVQRPVSSASQGKSVTDSAHADTSTLDGAETDPVVLLEQLNFWHHNELVAFNNPDKFPNYDVSGETVAWIAEIEKRFAKSNVTIEWDPESHMYIVVTNRK